MTDREQIHNIISDYREMLVDANDSIWEFSETRFAEQRSAGLLKEILSGQGFAVTGDVAGMETAFVASFGSGEPVIGFLAEYDALSGLSQKAGVSEKVPLVENGNGHGCGHHSLGVGCLAAAIAVKTWLEESKLPGTIRYYGCPGEEGGSGKTFMAKAGVFDDLDIALTWHPFSATFQFPAATLANLQAYFRFKGVSSHAAATPHLGRSALDAVELMNVGVNYLREHIIPEARLHYAVTNTGGISPNVVQAEAEVLYLIRAPRSDQVREVYERVCDVARGAALMTGTTMEIVFDKACSNLILNSALDEIIHQKLVEVGPVPFNEEDLQFCREIRDTMTDQEKNGLLEMLGPALGDTGRELLKLLGDKAIHDFIPPYITTSTVLPGSTDVADVSWIVPTAQFFNTCYAVGTPVHSWQLVAQGKSGLTHSGMLHAGEVLALTALDLFRNPEQVIKAKEELNRRLDNRDYICPIPPGVTPSRLK